MHVHTWKLLREEAGRGRGGGIGSGLVSSGGPFQLNFFPSQSFRQISLPP